MQRPIYNGVNRVVLDCAPDDAFESELCSALAARLEHELRMPVSTEQPVANAIGVLRVRMEAKTSAGLPRYRLVWLNDLPTRSGPVTVASEWISLPIDRAGDADSAALADALAATRP